MAQVSAVPATGSGLDPALLLFDKFNSGLANYLFKYYASGFLSLQVRGRGRGTVRVGLPSPYPQPSLYPYPLPLPLPLPLL